MGNFNNLKLLNLTILQQPVHIHALRSISRCHQIQQVQFMAIGIHIYLLTYR